jgi:hypothetical protein
VEGRKQGVLALRLLECVRQHASRYCVKARSSGLHSHYTFLKRRLSIYVPPFPPVYLSRGQCQTYRERPMLRSSFVFLVSLVALYVLAAPTDSELHIIFPEDRA